MCKNKQKQNNREINNKMSLPESGLNSPTMDLQAILSYLTKQVMPATLTTRPPIHMVLLC